MEFCAFKFLTRVFAGGLAVTFLH